MATGISLNYKAFMTKTPACSPHIKWVDTGLRAVQNSDWAYANMRLYCTAAHLSFTFIRRLAQALPDVTN
jgi:hypothetical protein